MKMPCPRWFTLAALALSGMHAAPADPPKEEAMASLIAGLADESYRVRVQATRELWELGEKALAALRAAEASGDPEISMRVKDLLRKIELGILPDSSPEIVELVVRYDGGSPQTRHQVIDRLKQLRAWRQLLKIYEMERDRNTLNLIQGSMEGVAIDAAREALAAEPPDPARALAYLEMAKPGPAEWMAAAVIHRSQGNLERELAKIPENAAADLQGRRYALLAAAGRLSEAAAAAAAAGLDLTAAQLRLLDGDPLPWLRIAPVPENDQEPPGIGDYREFAARRWEGGEAAPGDLRKFRRLAEAGDVEDQMHGLAMLYLTGDVAHADTLFAARFPMDAFGYHETFERIDEALAALGLDPAEPDYAAWAAKRFHVLIHTPDDENDETIELATMSAFLSGRGLRKELREAFLPGLKELAERNPEQFLSTCTNLFGGGLADTVLPAVLAYARDDEGLWQRVVASLFEGEVAAVDFWDWLGTLEPELSPAGRLEWMVMLMGYLPDREDRVEAFFAKAWPAIEAMNEADLLRRIGYIIRASSVADNPDYYPRAVERFQRIADARKSGNPYLNHYYCQRLASLGRWREAADLWLDWVRQAPEIPVLRAHAAACLRRLGEEKEAEVQERMAERLSLAEPVIQNACGEAFAMTGDIERAGRWWRRAAAEATSPGAFLGSFAKRGGETGPLLTHARETGDWKLAAALSEAEALQSAISGGAARKVARISILLRQRLNADMARVFASPGGKGNTRTLARIHELAATDGSLADYFYPVLRERGLKSQHDQWFEESWAALEKLISRFPEGHNLRNTAAWTASRANRRLDEAEAHLTKALEQAPRQAAYLDTMGEIWFARRDRAKAVEWSAKAVRHGSPSDSMLVRQHERFKTGDFPVP